VPNRCWTAGAPRAAGPPSGAPVNPIMGASLGHAGDTFPSESEWFEAEAAEAAEAADAATAADAAEAAKAADAAEATDTADAADAADAAATDSGV